MSSSSDHAKTSPSEALPTVENSLSANCEKSEEQQSQPLRNGIHSRSPMVEPNANRLSGLSPYEQNDYVQARERMLERTSRFKTARSIELSCPFYGDMEWLALESIIKERREQERQTPLPKRKRSSSQDSADNDSGMGSDCTEIISNHSGNYDHHPSTHESFSECEISAGLVDFNSLTSRGRQRGRPRKKACTDNLQGASSSKDSGVAAGKPLEPSGPVSPSLRIVGALTVSVQNEGGALDNAVDRLAKIHAASIPTSEVLGSSTSPSRNPAQCQGLNLADI
ncbi:hypothetical protein C8Q78DRAFT_1082314 [Trametes maxima]|nr:hypothetical protein C8Q78DRAFT_1082314 [Trametes maxima]